jgi:flagellar biosynthesis/type III secretory pathway protein FliH
MTWSSDWSQPPRPLEPGDPASDPWQLPELRVNAPGLHGEAARLHDDTLGISPEEEERIQRQAELEEAFARGYEQGVNDALERDGERIEQALLALADAVETVHGTANAWTRSAKDHVMALALAVARQVIDREVKGDAHAVADLVRKALSHFPIDEAVRIRVHPQDLSTISTASGPGGAGIRIAPGRNVQWIADADLATGGCVVEGRRRIVDGRVDLALERIYRKLVDD